MQIGMGMGQGERWKIEADRPVRRLVGFDGRKLQWKWEKW